MVTMAVDIHHMINGLKGIEQLDDISITLPEEIENFIDQYTSSIKDNSANELNELIRSLDHRVQNSLHNILNMAMIESTRDMDQDEIETQSIKLHQEVDKFEEHVYTSIGTRLHMTERELEVPLFKCDIPINVIKENIRKLYDKEKTLRVIITDKIDCMLDDISVFLNDATMPQELKEKILETQACLLKNKEHVVTGKRISSINLMIDTIELETDESESIQTPSHTRLTVSDDMEDDGKVEKNSLLKRFGIWVWTPLEVKWKDTKQYKS